MAEPFGHQAMGGKAGWIILASDVLPAALFMAWFRGSIRSRGERSDLPSPGEPQVRSFCRGRPEWARRYKKNAGFERKRVKGDMGHGTWDMGHGTGYWRCQNREGEEIG
jgi:hypothetical protein